MTDKAAHFLGGLILFLLCYPLGVPGAMLVVFAVAVLKELYDSVSGRGTPEVSDVVFTVLGGLTVALPADALGEHAYAYLGFWWVLWCFWALFVVMMGMYRAYLAKRLGPVLLVLGGPFVVVGLFLDFLAQMLVAPFVFRELPPVRVVRFLRWEGYMVEPLVTHRLRRHMAGPAGWRRDRAEWICNNMLDPIDPTGSHCR